MWHNQVGYIPSLKVYFKIETYYLYSCFITLGPFSYLIGLASASSTILKITVHSPVLFLIFMAWPQVFLY